MLAKQARQLRQCSLNMGNPKMAKACSLRNDNLRHEKRGGLRGMGPLPSPVDGCLGKGKYVTSSVGQRIRRWANILWHRSKELWIFWLINFQHQTLLRSSVHSNVTLGLHAARYIFNFNHRHSFTNLKIYVNSFLGFDSFHFIKSRWVSIHLPLDQLLWKTSRWSLFGRNSLSGCQRYCWWRTHEAAELLSCHRKLTLLQAKTEGNPAEV